MIDILLESCLLPILENALLNGSLVDMSKNSDLVISYF